MRIRSALAAVLVLCTTACGGGDTTSPGTKGNPSTPAPTTPVATSIVLSTQSVTINGLGATQGVGAEVRDQRGQPMSTAVSWSSASPGIASVSSSGLITSNAVGATDVVATAGTITATVRVVVAPNNVSITLSPNSLTLNTVGATAQLQAMVRNANGDVVTNAVVAWSANPTSVATVSSSGVVTAVGNGTASITATSAGASATANIGVQLSNGPSTCTQQPVFASHLLDPSMIKVITQIGVVGGGNTEIVGRSYVFPIDGIDGVRIPLNAPTALNVVAAKHYLPSGAPTSGYVPDWSLLLDAGCGIQLELFHVKDVAASIKAVADTSISNSSAWQPLSRNVPFAAGETFGWYMRGLNSVAFDVIVHDRNHVNQFTNQARYVTGRSNLLDVVCPWTLFAPNLRSSYLGAIGSQTGFRVAGAGCGAVNRDVPGTPAGQWFTSATVTANWPFAKVGHYGDPLPIVLGVDSTVYIGHTGPANDVRIYRENSTWKDPATITTSHCYQAMSGNTASGWLWLRMNSATQMDAAYGDTGACPATFPASGFMPYYR
ncbi:MAG: Ig-like domain-containing protein [Gemmatimonadaceae bacterium]|nr:Ig-like domain-containing protein [Gemmatimonadaceae bacterium]